MENPDGHSGFTRVGADIPMGTLSVRRNISVHLFDFANALYVVEACNSSGCTGSTEVTAMNGILASIGHFRGSSTEGEKPEEFDPFDNSASGTGAAYLFRFDGKDWSQEAYIKAENTTQNLGRDLALSADGNTVAIVDSSVVQIFRFDGATSAEEADFVPSTSPGGFGSGLALSEDGNTVAVGAAFEDSGATGINGDQNDNSAEGSGAVYVFRFDGLDWVQQAYVKASNAGSEDFFVKAKDLGLTVSETGEQLQNAPGAFDKLERLRAEAAKMPGLVESTADAALVTPDVPKLAIVGPAVS